MTFVKVFLYSSFHFHFFKLPRCVHSMLIKEKLWLTFDFSCFFFKLSCSCSGMIVSAYSVLFQHTVYNFSSVAHYICVNNFILHTSVLYTIVAKFVRREAGTKCIYNIKNAREAHVNLNVWTTPTFEWPHPLNIEIY